MARKPTLPVSASLFALFIFAFALYKAVPTPIAPSGGRTQAVKSTAAPTPAAPAGYTAVAAASAPKQPVSLPKISFPTVALDGTAQHTVQKGESLPGIIYRYLADTRFLTGRELEGAIRGQNPELKGIFPKPGTVITIPGYEPQPWVEKPRQVAKDFEVRAIYLTGAMAGGENGLRIIRRWRDAGGNAVVFDIKDSDGSLSVPFDHPLAPGNKRVPLRNLAKFIRYVHSLDMHAIARIAIFRDEHIANNHPEMAIRSRRTGEPWRENGKLAWTDPSKDGVQQYNIALARYAAQNGADEVQFDYVRFPAEGDQKDAKFNFETEHPQWKRADVITDFVAKAHAQLKPMGVLFSLDVFGVVAWQRPVDLASTGQDIPQMARHCDVLSPMIYPSHFFGMDGYALPGDAPEHFIGTSMDRFVKITADTGVVLRPWLQAFGWKTRTYSPEYIRVQVRVAKEKGGVGFLFWNARNDYGKPFDAMPEMMSAPGKFVRGDEMPSSRKPAQVTAALSVAPAGN